MRPDSHWSRRELGGYLVVSLAVGVGGSLRSKHDTIVVSCAAIRSRLPFIMLPRGLVSEYRLRVTSRDDMAIDPSDHTSGEAPAKLRREQQAQPRNLGRMTPRIQRLSVGRCSVTATSSTRVAALLSGVAGPERRAVYH